MNDASSYWMPVCKLASQLRCWVRIGSRANGKPREGRWGQLLTIPREGYLDESDGPVPVAEVKWVEISTRRIVGGIAGRPRQIEIKGEILERLREAGLAWELREDAWSVEGIFDQEPLQTVSRAKSVRADTNDSIVALARIPLCPIPMSPPAPMAVNSLSEHELSASPGPALARPTRPISSTCKRRKM